MESIYSVKDWIKDVAVWVNAVELSMFSKYVTN